MLKNIKWFLRTHLQLDKSRSVPRNSPATVPAFAKRSNPSPNEFNFVCRQPCRNRYDDPPHHRHTTLLSFPSITPCAVGPSTPCGTGQLILPASLRAPARSRTGSVASGAYMERHRRVARCLPRSGSFLGAAHEGWQGQTDSNRRIRESNSRALPLGHVPVLPVFPGCQL